MQTEDRQTHSVSNDEPAHEPYPLLKLIDKLEFSDKELEEFRQVYFNSTGVEV